MRQFMLLGVGFVLLALAVPAETPLALWLVLSFAAGPVAMTLLIKLASGGQRKHRNSNAPVQEPQDE